MNETPQLFVYYDKSCPICREEIGALKSIDHANALVLIDCSDSDFDDEAAEKEGISQETLKNTMHVRDSTGRWHVAADAFVAMYETVGFDSAAGMLGKRRVRSLFNWMYPFFVRHRHKLRFIGAHKIMPWIIRRAAAKQSARAQKCAIDRDTRS